jgi:uncharacterized protein (TIGR00297 family)
VLTKRGWFAALAVGACALAGGSWRYAAVLLAFFIPSMIVSRLGRERKRSLTDAGKTGPRDEVQVLANGGIAALCALGMALTHQALLGAAFAGAFAAAAADTFGTEIGTLAAATPRSILTFKPLARGLSGGLTGVGTIAEVAGSAIVGLVAWGAGIAPFWTVVLAGFAGATVDSLAGGCIQERRYCERCARECETDPHACGERTKRVRGAAWIGNDAVNFLATGTGALACAALGAWFSR